ncbi:methionyl-tRNA formyltransferase [Rivihabitans pingtungensis]|uniref:methionyl-tRNA formyltransferase n=1 Tax=Rivihabitans pingtungensis TaxID=1054498 RepID=UPI002353311A|nr:methionyl-tRNA formyltransferase [Rivihabitans pingtungensis]MCK6436611.1 methionyl-tRNA formyltransferase [Rivihabitans pingtungensis]
MKLIFAGTPEFAASALQALIDAGHDIALVLTQPDRPAGRGMKLKASPVKTLALAHGLPVSQPLTLKTAEAQAEIAAVGAEVMVVAAYGLILPKVVLEMPTRGCLNIHASLLPRWRGAAPIHRAIEAGDAETGVTIMQMDVGLDTGDMLLTVREPIHADDSTGSLHDRLAAQGAQAMVAALAQLDALSPQPQPAEGVTYAEKIGKAEAQLDWSLPAEVLHRKIRAFNPFPGASTLAGDEALKIWQAQLADGAGAPGEVLAADADGVRIACGSGALLATQLQAAGGKRLAAREFLAGHSLPARLGE